MNCPKSAVLGIVLECHQRRPSGMDASIPPDEGTLFALDEPLLPVGFQVKRFFFIEAMPHGAKRGGHAHKKQTQLIVGVSGVVHVALDCGDERCPNRTAAAPLIELRPGVAIFVPPMIWLTLQSASSLATVAVLASGPYEESDYLRSFNDFRNAARERHAATTTTTATGHLGSA